MEKQVTFDQISPVMTDVLSQGGEVAFTVTGDSMLPFLRGRRDKVLLKKPQPDLQKMDIVLYRRGNGQYVLHRLICMSYDGLVMTGDHQFYRETGIRRNQVLGIVKGFWRDEKYISCDGKPYRTCVRIWCFTRPVRKVFSKIRSICALIKGRLF